MIIFSVGVRDGDLELEQLDTSSLVLPKHPLRFREYQLSSRLPETDTLHTSVAQLLLVCGIEIFWSRPRQVPSSPASLELLGLPFQQRARIPQLSSQW